ncbi:biotin-independent malonate decarboxylase subunit beta [Actimicrobium sp. CCI2.3]|uniref:biotin-independent malonate decarboxylase subunit beta n=1 Tax=Actimicrobium sp. CCI2.3 TaxID=3048616 RepID=UPI002AB35A87|nr:biotin-independent malonate decarboxylase subunit beta [Actimicrobium sp. CCI2.3]MDY7574868.1 biotin-independent malonate decarboxylase subunit beta [Actimicrobium sp. CCI2.3]MEB0020171.1 biotin-independent malonate decarboxylase subunit beta [Actimicrobium sp. CCI2.3]
MSSYLEANARERIGRLLDPRSFEEFLPPSQRVVSPHLAQLDAPVAFDDGVVIGQGLLNGQRVFAAAQEGGFMGGAVGEVHGAKLVGLLQRAVVERVDAVILLLETGGVRLHEANAGLIAVSEVMRAVLQTRAAGIPVIVLIGGSNGCFGGMGIVARCANFIVMSEEGRLAMSGPEVIETASGVEEFDSRDRALVWRTTGGKHRYLLGDCQAIVTDDIDAFRQAATEAVHICGQGSAALTLAALEAEQAMLAARLQDFGTQGEPMDIWRRLGIDNPEIVPMLEATEFTALVKRSVDRQGAK